MILRVFCAVHATDKILWLCKPKFQKKPIQFSNETNHKNLYVAGFFIGAFRFPIDIFLWLYRNPPYTSNTVCGEITRLQKVNNVHVRFPFSKPIQDQPYNLLVTLALSCIRILSKFCVCPVREEV